MKKIIFDISVDHVDFFEFAYTLRKMDSLDRNTRRLLDGRLKPDVLVDIVFSNHFDGDELVLKKGSAFQMFIDTASFQSINLSTKKRGNQPSLLKDAGSKKGVTDAEKSDKVNFLLTDKGFKIVNSSGKYLA